MNGLSDDGTALTAPFAGYSDWRLPTILEMETVAFDPCPDSLHCYPTELGPGGPQGDFYWSCSSLLLNPSNLAWYNNIHIDFNEKVVPFYYARAVRDPF